MKKLTALLCVLCTLSLLSGALAAPGDAYLFTDDQKEELGISDYSTPTMAVVGDTVYTLWGSDVFTWKVGTDTPEKVASNLFSGYYDTYDDAQSALGDDAERLTNLLISDGEAVYGLNDLNGYLYPLTFAEGQATLGEPVKLDWSPIEEQRSGSDYTEVSRPCIVGGSLYLLVRDGNDYDNPLLYAFDLETGEAKTTQVSFVQDMTPYRDGTLLMEIYDYSTAYDSDTGKMRNPTLSVFNPADGSVTPAGTLGNSNVSGLAYDADSDTLYYTTNSMLMAMPALGEATQVAYMPVDYASDAPACVLPGGLYAIDMWSGLIVRNTDPQYLPATSLSIYGGNLDSAASAFMAQYPDVPLVFNQDVYYDSASSLAQAMVSGDASFDVYYYDLSYQDFASLMKKGYCLDLSPYSDITDQLNEVYPFIQSAITENGVFYAVPTYLYSNGLSFYNATWEEAGLTDKLPTSFMGLIDFMQWWVDEGMDEHPDLQLMQYAYDYGDTLFYLALNLYIDQYQAEGKDLALDTPLFREMLQAIEDLDCDELNETIPEEDDSDSYISYEEEISNYLFTNYGDWLSAYAYSDYATPLVLPIEDGGPAYVPAYVTCAFINPNSQNMDMAVQYLRSVLNNMEDVQRIMLFPDDNDPVPNQYYTEMVADYENMLAEAQAKLETAAPEDVKDIQSSIDSYNSFLAKKDEYYWTASAESIAAYREMAKLCYAATPNVLSYSVSDEASSEISSLISRYEQKQITLDQFVTQADQKIRMIQLEGQ